MMRRPGESSWTERGQQAIGGAARQTQEAIGEATERVQESWEYYSHRAESEFDRWMRENPLTVGAAAVALGAAVGLSAPRTETEDAWMGETRDALVERAQEAAQDTVSQAQQVVENVTEAAQGTVEQAQRAVDTVGKKTGAAGAGTRG